MASYDKTRASFLMYLILSISPLHLYARRSNQHLASSSHGARARDLQTRGANIALEREATAPVRVGKTSAALLAVKSHDSRGTNSDFFHWLMRADVQYKHNRMGRRSGYQDATVMISLEENTSKLRLHAFNRDNHSELATFADGIEINMDVNMQLIQNRGSRVLKPLILRLDGYQEYVKIRAPRSTLMSVGPTRAAPASSSLSIWEYDQSGQETATEYSCDLREQRFLTHLQMNLEMHRNMLSLPSCVASGTCVSPCRPPIRTTTEGGLTCLPYNFCTLRGNECQPVEAKDGDDSAVAEAWTTSLREVAVAMNEFSNDQTQARFKSILSTISWMKRLEERVVHLEDDHLWMKTLPSFVSRVRAARVDSVVDEFADVLGQSGIFEEQVKSEFNCTISKPVLKGLSIDERSKYFEQLSAECPQMMDSLRRKDSIHANSLMQADALRMGTVATLALEPFTIALIITASLAVVFLGTGAVMRHFFEEGSLGEKVGNAFLVAGGVCVVALVIELAILCSISLSPWTCKAISNTFQAFGSVAR